MQISNNLLSLTLYKSQCKALEEVEMNTIQDTEALDNTAAESAVTIPAASVPKANKSMLTADIKSAIYNYCHPTVTGVTNSSYGMDFNSICTTLGIGPNSTITKADLTKLTRDDTKEDSNNDFFGALNRAFSYLKPEDTISYNDLMLFFMRGAGNDGNLNFSEYQNVVNQYSDIVQKQYDACKTPQEKLEFALEKTRDYLTESCMDLQLMALERLTTTVASENVPDPDTETYTDAVKQVANVGQIAFADLGGYKNGSITLGSYATTRYASDHYKSSDVIMWAGDSDGEWYDSETDEKGWNDGGITLNSRYYLDSSHNEWYKIVETFVHELTHATAFYYYVYNSSTGNVGFSRRGIDFMLEKGLINQTQYNKFSSLTDADWPEYIALVNSMWDEWAAYTTSCNYWDSIGGDVFNSNQDLAVNGPQEQSAIDQHLIDTDYDKYVDGVWTQVPDPMEYFNWDYDKFQNMFYFDLNA